MLKKMNESSHQEHHFPPVTSHSSSLKPLSPAANIRLSDAIVCESYFQIIATIAATTAVNGIIFAVCLACYYAKNARSERYFVDDDNDEFPYQRFGLEKESSPIVKG